MTNDTPTNEPTIKAAPKWAALDVTLWAIEKVKPYEKNSRKHSATQIAQIASAITEWGFTFPLLVDEQGILIAGHARWEAAKLLKLREVPVAVARDWTDEQKRAYVIADNRLAESSTWDSANLLSELATLATKNFDVELMGFSDKQFAKLMNAASVDLEALAAKPSEPTPAVSHLSITCPSCAHVFAITKE